MLRCVGREAVRKPLCRYVMFNRLKSSVPIAPAIGDAKMRHGIDLRSDTVTKPTREMRRAMMEADVGDDVYGEDPTMNLLEKEAANIFSKESALFVPSGTMGNLICVMLHCSGQGEEVLLGDSSHIGLYEQGGLSSIGGVYARTVRTMPDGTLDLEDLCRKIMPDDIHCSLTRLVCVENTHNIMGGRVLSLEYMDKIAELTKSHHLKLHVDGARIFNAATALGVPVAALVEHADSVMFCLSKSLGAPVGSIIAGSTTFISRARRLRKSLGGGIRQAGVLAAPGLIALQNMSQMLAVDHKNAQRLAVGLATMEGLGIVIDPKCVETNIVNFIIKHPQLNVEQLLEKLVQPSQDGLEVKMLLVGPNTVRAVTHHQISEQDIDDTINKMKDILTVL